MESQNKALNLLDDFVRDELSDCESYTDSLREIRRFALQRTEIKSKVDQKLEAMSYLERKSGRY
jgi:hypothetical protein